MSTRGFTATEFVGTNVEPSTCGLSTVPIFTITVPYAITVRSVDHSN